MLARRSPQSSLSTDQNWLDRQIRGYVRAGEGAKVLLARAISRQREIATRLALGSSRARIVRQSLIEALMLSFIGGVLGLAVAFAATRALIAFVAEGATNIPLDPRPDAIVLLFTFSISLFAGLLFGLAPALHAARSSAGLTLTASTRTAAGSAGRGGRVWPKVLVTAQIMLSLLLLVGAGLFLRTLRNLADQDFGFESTHLLIAQFDAHLAGYKPEQAPGLNQRLLERLSSTPGVRSAALGGSPPVSSSTWRSFITIPGYTPAPKEDMSSVLNRVTGNYFETAGISMLAGRAIGSADNAMSLKVAVINQVMASKFFPKGDAVGRTLKVDVDSISGPWHIVGVARDTKSSGPREETDRMIYFPLAQVVGKNGEGIQDSFVNTILLRTTGDPATAIHDLRSAVATVDPNLPIPQVHTIQEQLESFMSHEVLISRLTAIFARSEEHT